VLRKLRGEKEKGDGAKMPTAKSGEGLAGERDLNVGGSLLEMIANIHLLRSNDRE